MLAWYDRSVLLQKLTVAKRGQVCLIFIMSVEGGKTYTRDKGRRFSWSLDLVNTAGCRLAELPLPSADAELARVSTFSHLASTLCQNQIKPDLSCIIGRVQK